MRGLKELPHSCFSFLLQISSKPFSVKDYQLIQYLIPVPVSLRPLFDYVLAGKIQHLFQCRIALEYAFRFRDFPILAVQSFYDICRVHNASDIIRKLEKTELTSSQLFSQLLIAYGYSPIFLSCSPALLKRLFRSEHCTLL